MFKIKTLNAIASIGLNQFPREWYEVGTEIAHPDALLVRSYDLHSLAIPHSVKVVGRAGVGVDNIPIPEMTKRGIVVLNTPGANANAVKELVLAGMLLASRHICQAVNYVNELPTQEGSLDKKIEQHKKQFAGFELMGHVLGVIGLGNVGVKVANAATHLGMRVIGYDPSITVKRAWELSSTVEQAHNIQQLLAEADFVSLHIPLTEKTTHMINHSLFNIMKNGVVLLNFARSEIVDHGDLLDALNEKKVSTYVNDFPYAKLKNHPHVISLPHLGASTQEAENNCAVMIAKHMREYFENGAIINSVNLPTVEIAPLHIGERLTIVNENIPNMVAQISANLGKAKLNILSLLNKSRDNIAYTVIDLNEEIPSSVIKEIGDIHGVLQVRKIHTLK